MINAKKILQEQLARSMGLDSYAAIINGDPSSLDFQHLFNSYYVVRRNEEWRKCYYELFIKAKNGHWSFEQIITELYSKTGNVEASFSSKMLATIDPAKPIWDQYVLQNLGLKLKGKTQEEKLQNAIRIYKKIEQWYTDYLPTEEAQANIKEFDQQLPVYKWISNTKKIDCLLWGKR